MFNVGGKVRVVAAQDGNVVTVNPNKNDFGSIALEQTLISNKNGFISKKRRVAFLQGPIDDVRAIVEENSLFAGKELPGRVFIVESEDPLWLEQQPKINPTTGNAVYVNGKPVYMKFFYDETGSIPDTYLIGPTSVGPKIAEPKASIHIIETSNLGN